MMKTKSLSLVFLAGCIVLTGCSSIRRITMPDEDNLLSGAGSVMVGNKNGEARGFEQIDIAELLKKYGFDEPQKKPSSADVPATASDLQYRRNDLQDVIIAASNQRCAAYLRTLISSKAQTQMGWGGLATFLSGAATVTTPIAAAQVLSAGSTISSSFLSLYNEAYFNSLSVNVISAGISKQREGLLQYLDEERKKEMSQYPVHRAIADALAYHAACNIVSGLEAAAAATNAADAKAVAGKKVSPVLSGALAPTANASGTARKP
jgi:uncharacterized protein YceK